MSSWIISETPPMDAESLQTGIDLHDALKFVIHCAQRRSRREQPMSNLHIETPHHGHSNTGVSVPTILLAECVNIIAQQSTGALRSIAVNQAFERCISSVPIPPLEDAARQLIACASIISLDSPSHVDVLRAAEQGGSIEYTLCIRRRIEGDQGMVFEVCHDVQKSAPKRRSIQQAFTDRASVSGVLRTLTGKKVAGGLQ